MTKRILSLTTGTAMDVRYQVFVSSTFVDLKEERSAVFQTLMEMDCIPAGMELFPAMDDEQWNFIKRIVDDCDYYTLILGSRYGSISEAGISYTEMEYDYAIEKGLKVLAFVHQHPEDRPAKLADADPSLRAKLDAFRTKVCTGRLVKFWNETKELPGLVALSLNKTIRTYPAIGWVRANKIRSEDAVAAQNELLIENEALRKELSKLKAEQPLPVQDLADLDEEFEVNISYPEYEVGFGTNTKRRKLKFSWRKIFSAIAPDLQAYPNDALMSRKVGDALMSLVSRTHNYTVDVNESDLKTIRTQLSALGLIEMQYAKTTGNSSALFWALTQMGTALMFAERTVKSKPQGEA